MKAFDYPFRLGPGGSFAMCPDYNHVVRAQVIDALMTNLGERVFRPRYGCDFQAALFDPADELTRRDAASLIAQRLQQLVTRCIVRSVTVEEGTPGTVIITVIYRCSLYATDTQVAVPLASEFINRQRAIQNEIVPLTPGGVNA